ncbi:unnamed protein product, partial [Protopolystoma xenopodis]
MFVRALATECRLPLVSVQASRIFGRYVGDSERNMRQILVQARASAPAILFIDEIDLLLPSRSSNKIFMLPFTLHSKYRYYDRLRSFSRETCASEHVLSEMLTAMDGVEGQPGQLILIAATNRIDKLDCVSDILVEVIHITDKYLEETKREMELELIPKILSHQEPKNRNRFVGIRKS